MEPISDIQILQDYLALPPEQKLDTCTFEFANLEGADFSDCYMLHSTMNSTRLQRAIFRGALVGS